MAKVSVKFMRGPQSILALRARTILSSMTGNTNYPTPSPTLAVLEAAVSAYEAALGAATDGGREAMATKNAAREELQSVLRNLSLYVQAQCDGDLAILISSGFEVQKTREPSGILPAPQFVVVETNRLSGRFHVRPRPVARAVGYEVQSTTQPTVESSWISYGVSTNSRVTLDGFTPGMVYTFRVRAVGTKGWGGWSDPISQRAI